MSEKSTTDQILDLLLDALQERQAARDGLQQDKTTVSKPNLFETEETAVVPNPVEIETVVAPKLIELEIRPSAKESEPKAETTSLDTDIVDVADDKPEIAVSKDISDRGETDSPTEEAPNAAVPERQPSIDFGPLLGRMMAGIALLVMLINIPFNQHGTALARAMPDEAALVIRDGLLLKGSGEEVYVLQNNELRWITSLDAFELAGYRWENVHEVDDSFLERFDEGYPVYIAYKCTSSPHVYVLEDGKKRWVKDVPTFSELGLVWDQIRYWPCDSLRDIPDGLPIPEDAGEPPQP